MCLTDTGLLSGYYYEWIVLIKDECKKGIEIKDVPSTRHSNICVKAGRLVVSRITFRQT